MPTFANNSIQWSTHLLFRVKVDGEPCHIQRDITTPFLPRDTTLRKNVTAEKAVTERTIVWHARTTPLST